MTQIYQSAFRNGDAGVFQTLEHMRALVNASLATPIVVETARELAIAAGSNDEETRALTIRAWLKSVWTFVNDPLGEEHLEDPVYLLNRYRELGKIPGDCDEVAILGAALGKAQGIPADFIVCAFDDGTDVPLYSHVYALLYPLNAGQVSLDVTKPFQSTARVARRRGAVV